MIKRVNTVALAAFLLVCPSCFNAPTGPEDVNPSTFFWKAESVASNGGWGLEFTGVWGTSRSHLYITSESSDRAQKLHHFDGVTIDEVQIPFPAYPNDPMEFYAIQGISSDQIWIVGERSRFNFTPPPNYYDSSFIQHFDGSTWSIQLEGIGGRLFGLLALASNEVYAAGSGGTIFRFDGSSWRKEEVRHDLAIQSLARGSDGLILASASREANAYPPDAFILKRSSAGWSVVDSTTGLSAETRRFGHHSLVQLDGTLFGCYPGIYSNSGSGWQTEFYSDSLHILRIAQFGPHGLLACGSGATLLYYDGTKWMRLSLPVPPSVWFTSVWSDGRTIALTGDDEQNVAYQYLFVGYSK